METFPNIQHNRKREWEQRNGFDLTRKYILSFKLLPCKRQKTHIKILVVIHFKRKKTPSTFKELFESNKSVRLVRLRHNWAMETTHWTSRANHNLNLGFCNSEWTLATTPQSLPWFHLDLAAWFFLHLTATVQITRHSYKNKINSHSAEHVWDKSNVSSREAVLLLHRLTLCNFFCHMLIHP